jgi:Holliday junction DNA helicase RuvA
VDLKDKVLKIDLGEESKVDSGEPIDALFPIEANPIKDEAVSALTMLGFSAAASAKVVDKILKGEPDAPVEAVIRQALKML